MKKVLIATLSLFAASASAQTGLTQNAEGSSSLLYRGSDLNIDVAETNLNLGFNNLRKSLGVNDKFIYGGSVSAKNEEGIGNLFTTGDLVPTSKANAFLGWSFSNAIIPSARKDVIFSEINDLHADWEKNFPGVAAAIVASELKGISDNIERMKLERAIMRSIKSKPADDVYEFLDSYTADNDAPEEVSNAVENIKTRIGDFSKPYFDKITGLYTAAASIDSANSEKPFWHLSLFTFGGVRATEFKHFTGFDTLNYGNSFSGRYFRGGHLGIGGNFQYKNVLVGLTYSYVETNNFKLLTKKEYVLTDKRSSGTTTLTEEKKVTAYAGDYGVVEINELAFDLAVNVPLDKKAKFYTIINPYTRAMVATRNAALLPNKWDIGSGFYFYKTTGKLMGGVYLELPDVENNYEKMKPIDKQNLRPPMQRLTFGIVAKISLNSVLNSF